MYSNITKLNLIIITIVFDTMIYIQHYCIYKKEIKTLEKPLLEKI